MVKVSVIIPTFNNQKTIARAIRSVQNQSLKDIEILVIDNGSTDETISIVKKITENDLRVKLLSIQTKGRSRARNIGIRFAKGSYIQFLDSDDELGIKKIAKAVNILEKNESYFAIATNVCFINDQTGKISYKNITFPYKNSLYGCNPYQINSLLFRNKKIRLFHEDIEYCEDWLFWFENLVSQKIYVIADDYEAIVHITGKNTSSNYEIMNFYLIYVRALIKSEASKMTLRLFARDIKLSSKYLLLNQHVGKLNHVIDVWMKREINLVRVLFLFSPVKRYFETKELEEKNNTLY